MDYLQTQDVRFSYDEDESGIVEVLKGVTLGIQKGDFVSLLGLSLIHILLLKYCLAYCLASSNCKVMVSIGLAFIKEDKYPPCFVTEMCVVSVLKLYTGRLPSCLLYTS